MKVQLNLGKAFKYPFANETSLQRLGVLFLLFVVVFAPMLFITAQIDPTSSSLYEEPVGIDYDGFDEYEYYTETADSSLTSNETYAVGAGLYTMVAGLVFMFYYYGYTVSLIRGVIDEDKSIPEHSGAHFTPGFKLFGAVFIVTMILMILLFIAMFVLAGSAGLTGFSEGASVAAGLGMMMLLFGVIVLFGLFVYPAILYYVSVDDALDKALSPKHLWALIKVYWVDLLVTSLVLIAVSFGISIGTTILQFIPYIGPVLTLAISTALGLVSLVLYGDVFRQIYQQQHALQKGKKA